MIIRNGWHFVLPYSLGEFYLKEDKRVAGKKVLNKIETIRQKKLVYTFNNHTLRKTFRFVRDRSHSYFTNSKYYKFAILHGKHKRHRKYKIGREAISNFLFSIGSDPSLKVPNPINQAIRRLQEPDE